MSAYPPQYPQGDVKQHPQGSYNQPPPQGYNQPPPQGYIHQPPQAYGQPHPQGQHYPQQMATTMQPTAHPGMDPMNAKNVPRTQTGQREWSHGLCDCFGDCGTCFLSWCCPCIVYSQNKQRLESLQRSNAPLPDGGDAFSGDCFLYSFLNCCGFGWVLQIGTREQIRKRYGIEGGGCGDCCTSYCCVPCALTQESREIELEEGARGFHKH